ncbi:MAG: FeoA family protein [Gammaproteobacteria bacterium]
MVAHTSINFKGHPFTDLPLTLGRLTAGEVAVILSVPAISSALFQRFAARGILPGAEVTLLQQGDPIAVRLEETRWAISRAEAEQIEVALIGGR